MSNEQISKTVNFVYNGEVVATQSVALGECPTPPAVSSAKEGYRLMWLGADKAVEEDVTLVAYEVLGNPEQLLYALSHALLAYHPEKADNTGNVFSASMCIIYLASEVRHNPNHEIFCARAVEHLKHFVNPEKNVAKMRRKSGARMCFAHSLFYRRAEFKKE